MKAKFVGRFLHREYNDTIVDLEYEYRGQRYTIHENLNKGNEPLSWQHKSEQGRIDRIIERENVPKYENTISVDDTLKELFAYWDG